MITRLWNFIFSLLTSVVLLLFTFTSLQIAVVNVLTRNNFSTWDMLQLPPCLYLLFWYAAFDSCLLWFFCREKKSIEPYIFLMQMLMNIRQCWNGREQSSTCVTNSSESTGSNTGNSNDTFSIDKSWWVVMVRNIDRQQWWNSV